jgi:hypothetical protein
MINSAKRKTLIGVAFSVLLLPCQNASSATVTFDNYVSPTDNDFVNQFNNNGDWIQTAAGGITGGAVQTSGNVSSPIFTSAYAPLGGVTTSVYLKRDNVFPATGSGYSARLGFVATSTTPLSAIDNNAYFWGEYLNDGVLGIRYRAGVSTFTQVANFGAPQFGNWLKLTFNETYLGANQFQLSTSLEDFGPTGTGSPVALGSGSIIVNNPLAAADTSVYAGFDGYYHVAAFDNFAVVPEPSLLGLLGLGGLLACVVRRGKRGARHS